jgi:Protein of unknown function (DUF2778)
MWMRSTSARIGAPAIGFALGLLVTYGFTETGLRAAQAPKAVSTTVDLQSIELERPAGSRIPGMRLASLEMPLSFDFSVEDTSRTPFAQPDASFSDRFLLDQRFAGAASSPDNLQTKTGGTQGGTNKARLRAPDLAGDATAALRAVDDAAPKPSLLANAAKKRLHIADISNDPNSFLNPDRRIAIYDIVAHAVYLPDGRRLEAHSGFGEHMDDPQYVSLRGHGPTPPNVYNLALREDLFHGVRAIRLIPVDDGKMFGRDGMLAHPYMLGPNGQSNGCVSFSDYPAFLDAFLKGKVERLVVVEHLANAPPAELANAPPAETASGWLPAAIKSLFKSS